MGGIKGRGAANALASQDFLLGARSRGTTDSRPHTPHHTKRRKRAVSATPVVTQDSSGPVLKK
jgi:hypothetical protein